MSARPIADIRLVRHVYPMTDPFRTLAKTERLKAVLWLLVLAVFLAVFAFLLSRVWDPRGQLIEARIERFGVEATKYGNRPIITVRLADGSIRQVLTTRTFVPVCKQGDRITLVQRRTALSVAVRACQPN